MTAESEIHVRHNFNLMFGVYTPVCSLVDLVIIYCIQISRLITFRKNKNKLSISIYHKNYYLINFDVLPGNKKNIKSG